jgi:type III secretory pathway lipoprotein EscJ
MSNDPNLKQAMQMFGNKGGLNMFSSIISNMMPSDKINSSSSDEPKTTQELENEIERMINDINETNKCKDTNELNESNKNKNELEVYVELGIKYKLFQKMKGHSIWINIGFLIKNELGEKGIDLFINLSKDDPKFVEADVKALYEQLNKTVKAEAKKPLTIATLIKYFKDTDKDLTKILIKEAKNLLNKNEKNMTAYDDKDIDFSFEHDKLAHFDSVYFNSFRKSYKIQKKYMEHFISKVLRPEPQYIYIEGKQDIGKKSCIFSENIGFSKEAFKNDSVLICDLNVKSLEEKMSLLINDKDLNVLLRENSRNFFLMNYQIDDIAQRYYNEIILSNE